MAWNWELPDWPQFRFDAAYLIDQEARFLKQGGGLLGAFRHLAADSSPTFAADLLTSEAMKTSAIEGEILDRDSVQSSIRRQLGLKTDARQPRPAEQGVAEVMVNVTETILEPLKHETLWQWQTWLMQGRTDVKDLGKYRTHPDPMQIVSGRIDRQVVHFEAPPSSRVPDEMDGFIYWFNSAKLGAIARAGLAHIYFETIHPFEDGNGRVGRAISEKALGQALGQPSMTLLSTQIERRRSEYYLQLHAASRTLEMTEWLVWFGDVVLAAQADTEAWITFVIGKTRLFDRLKGRINPRQERVLTRLTREGPAGFTGGLSSANYQTITGASPATAGRDLAELVEWGALRRTGELKSTRYWLNLYQG